MRWTVEQWGQLGDLVGGLANAAVVALAMAGIGFGFKEWRDKQRAQKEEAEQEARRLRLDEERLLHGWSAGGVDTFKVSLVENADEASVGRQRGCRGQAHRLRHSAGIGASARKQQQPRS